jgi:hypothetical protein
VKSSGCMALVEPYPKTKPESVRHIRDPLKIMIP